MQTLSNASRRNFLKVAATAGGGLLLGFGWAEAVAQETAVDGVVTTVGTVPGVGFNSYLSINPQGIITILSPNPE
ncbi:MAG: twin-arginine translocation signal domain-containing protein, partial [Cytophagaceae bacterium]